MAKMDPEREADSDFGSGGTALHARKAPCEGTTHDPPGPRGLRILPNCCLVWDGRAIQTPRTIRTPVCALTVFSEFCDRVFQVLPVFAEI